MGEERQRRKDSAMQPKDWLKIVVMPTLIAIVAAILSIYLQNRSFEKNTLFKAKLDQIQAGQNETVKLLEDLDSTLRSIRSNEELIQSDLKSIEKDGDAEELNEAKQHYCAGTFMQSSIETLKRYKVRSTSIEDYSAGAGQNSAVNTAITDFTNKLGGLIQCMENKECHPCNAQHDEVRESLRAVIKAHTEIKNALLKGK